MQTKKKDKLNNDIKINKNDKVRKQTEIAKI